jgi:hypothetical protein
MWQLFRAEMDYFKKRFYSVLLIIPGFCIYTLASNSKSWFILPSIIIVVVLTQMFIGRIQEKRDRQHAILPVSAEQIARVRALIVMIPIAVVHLISLALHFSIAGRLFTWENGGADLVLFTGLILCGFSLYFILKDRVLPILKVKSSSELDTPFFLITVFAVIFVLPLTIVMITYHNLQNNVGLILSFLLVGLHLIFMTGKTYVKRRSYLE